MLKKKTGLNISMRCIFNKLREIFVEVHTAFSIGVLIQSSERMMHYFEGYNKIEQHTVKGRV